jgi:hypothetical protein
MADDNRTQSGILGDITPNEVAVNDHSAHSATGSEQEDIEGMEGGSKHDRSHHSGSRDVTEGVTGGLGTEVGGTRNFRQGTGATGGDIGNRPE